MYNLKKLSLAIAVAAPLFLAGCEATYVVGDYDYGYSDDFYEDYPVGYWGPGIDVGIGGVFVDDFDHHQRFDGTHGGHGAAIGGGGMGHMGGGMGHMGGGMGGHMGRR